MVKSLPANAGDIRDAGLMTRLGRLPGGGHGNLTVFSLGEFLWTEEPGMLQSMGLQRVRLKQLNTAQC